MNQQIRPGQLIAVLVLASAAWILEGGNSLPGILAGTILLLLLPILLCFSRRPRKISKLLLYPCSVLLGLIFLLEAALSAGRLGVFASQTEQAPGSIPLLVILLVGAAWYGASLGLESHARAMGLWVGGGVLLLGTIAVYLLPYVSIHQLRQQITAADHSVWRDGYAFVAGFGGELLLLWLLCRRTTGMRPRHGVYFAVSAGGLALLCTGLAMGILGPWSGTRTEPLYTAAIAVSPESAFRPDSFYTVLRIAAHYSRVCIFLMGFFRCLQVFPRKWAYGAAGVTGAVFTAVAGVLLSTRPETIAILSELRRTPVLMLGVAVPLLTGGF